MRPLKNSPPEKIFVFRGDANAGNGLGHLNRLAILAKAVKRSGGAVFFAVKDTDAKIIASHHLAGLDIIKIPSGVSNIEEVEYIEKEILLSNGFSGHGKVLAASSYDIRNPYFKEFRRSGWKIAWFDDLNKFRADCDILINANIFSLRPGFYERYARTETKLFLGPRYYMIRDEFEGAAARADGRGARYVPEILVTMGGSDCFNVAGKLVRALDDIEEEFEIKVVTGAVNQRRAGLLELCGAGLSHSASVVDDSAGLAEIFAGCDIAVTAGGGTNYEMIYLGKPVITFPMTANEKLNSEFIEKAGFGAAVRLNNIGGNIENARITAGAEKRFKEHIKLLLDESFRKRTVKKIKKAAAGYFKKDMLVKALMEL